MSEPSKTPDPSPRELIELWIAAFGEPPPLVHDPALMMRLIEEALARAPVRKTGS